jgi:hypothetical protein
MTLGVRLSVWFVVAGLTAGCGGVRVRPARTAQSVTQRLDAADDLARLGRYAEARAGYAAVLKEPGIMTGGDRAWLGLARLALNPKNPERDERQAGEYLDRLLVDFPESESAAEGWTWRTLLWSVERLQRDVRRSQQDLNRLRRELQREQQETVRLREERDRLREIDIVLERPRMIQPTPTHEPVRLRD